VLHNRTRIVPERPVRVAGRTVTILSAHAPVPASQQLAVTLVALAYLVVGVAVFGRTIGKALVGLAVVRSDGARPGWTAAVVRQSVLAAGWIVAPLVHATADVDLPAIVSWISLLWPVVVLLPIIFDPDRQGLHDRAARTRVVRRRASNELESASPFLVG
jgi:uncharacterized RDD family membrane protein YckC